MTFGVSTFFKIRRRRRNPTRRSTFERHDMAPPEVVILLIGPTGSGKTSFIKRVAGLSDKDMKIQRESLHPGKLPIQEHACGLLTGTEATSGCKTYRFVHRGTNFALIDTPGLRDVAGGNIPVLANIAKLLKWKAPDRPWVAGAIYFHAITCKRFAGPVRFNFDLFKAMCGETFYSRIACVTTLWGDVGPERLEQFDGFSKELRAEYFNITNSRNGGIVFDLKDSDPVAYDRVLDHFAQFAGNNIRWLRFEREVVHDGVKEIKRTAAGKLLQKRANQGICTIT